MSRTETPDGFDDVVRTWRRTQGGPSPTATARWKSLLRDELETEVAGVGSGFLWAAAAVLLLGLHMGVTGAWASSYDVDDPVHRVVIESASFGDVAGDFARHVDLVTQTARGI